MTEEKKELAEGEKYLSIEVEILGQAFRIPAFINYEKSKPTHPDWKGKNVAVWVSTKKKKEEFNPLDMIK